MRTTLVVLACLVLTTAACQAQESDDEARAAMAGMLAAMVELLPASLDEDRWSDPARRDELAAHLDALASSSHQLSALGGSRELAFEFLARSLESDVRRIRRAYLRGRYDESRFFVGQLAQTCVACHSRLPDADDPQLATSLLEGIDGDALSDSERARALVATRQFEAALELLEARMADPAISPAKLDLDGDLLRYLTVTIRVKRDAERAKLGLKGLQARPDVAFYLQRNLEVWLACLDEIGGQLDTEPELARARAWIERGGDLVALPADRRGLVFDLAASSQLHRLVAVSERGSQEAAEAYYLLGVADASSSGSYWLSQAEFYLETAIRTNPSSPVAERAYALLEHYTVLGYSGSSGVHIPPDVQGTLDGLRILIEEAPAAPPNP